MSLLAALVDRYQREADAGRMPVPGYSPAQIGWFIVLDLKGEPVECHPFRTADKKPRPRTVLAPSPPKRSSGVASGAFWDKTSYVLGVTAIDPAASPERQARNAGRCAQEHSAFKARHEILLAGVQDEGCAALLNFLRAWSPDRYDSLPDLPDGALDENLAFQLDGEDRFIHERPAARMAVAAELAARQGAEIGSCLITGATGPIARLHPSIKGVHGAQSSGAALVSFNRDAFESWGKTQGFNAPISEGATEGYAAALNGLIAGTRGVDAKGYPLWTNRIRLGGDTVVFWAETRGAEEIMGAMLEGPPPATDSEQTARVRDVISLLEQGKGLKDASFEVEPSTKVYILGLSPNAARLSVRFWREDTLGELAERFREHWNDLRLDPAPHGGSPPVWRLLLELAAQRKPENVPAHLAGEITRSILTGARYPMSMLTQTILRIRADQDRPDPKNPSRTLEKVSPLRVAMLKAWLARDARKTGNMEDLVMLDLTSTNPAYRLGRLFAVLERLQRAALGQRNATIRDRFYASASSTPERVFASLIRNARNHGKRLRSTVGGGLAEWFEDQITEVVSAISDFPKALTLQEQGRFALGYYHEREALNRKRAENTVLAHAEDTNDATETEDA